MVRMSSLDPKHGLAFADLAIELDCPDFFLHRVVLVYRLRG